MAQPYRFWEHTIRDDQDYNAHMDYIHFNPVKHGYTKTPAAWPHSTFHHAVINGLYPQSWSPTPQNLSTGEPNPD